jgi:hypothetical protein
MMVGKKSLTDIVNEKFPSLKVSILKINDEVLYYDAYADETEVEDLKIFLAQHNVTVKIERRAF